MTHRVSRPGSGRADAQRRYLSQAAQLEETVSPQVVTSTLTAASLAIVVFLAWAALTNINEVAHASGQIVPEGLPQTVQHLEGGLVSDIRVQDGDIVKAGDTLVVLNEASLREDRAALQARLLALRLEAERLRAFMENRAPDFTQFPSADDSAIKDNTAFFRAMKDARTREEHVIKQQIRLRRKRIASLEFDGEATQRNLAIVQRLFDTRQRLNAKGLSSLVQLLEDEARLNEIQGKLSRIRNDVLVATTEMAEFETRLAALSARHRDEASATLSKVQTEIEEGEAALQKLEERIGRLVIRAPEDGLVKGLAINTLGAVVKPGEPVMDIVPLGRALEAIVQVKPRDIGHIAVGLPVKMKLTSFDFARYGTVPGTVEHISATTFADDQGEPYFQVRIALEQEHIGGAERAILPGMTVLADIVTGDKTVLQYLLKPVHVSIETALRER